MALARHDRQAISSLAATIRPEELPIPTLLRLTGALVEIGDAAPAANLLEAASRIHPSDFWIHELLYLAYDGSQANGSEQAARHAAIGVALRPSSPSAHSNLGNVLSERGESAAAEAEFRAAIRFRPSDAEAHSNLGLLLRQFGRFEESLSEFEKGHELGSKSPGWRYPSAQWVAEARRLVALEPALPAVLRGERKPADDDERVALAQVSHGKKLYAAAARLSAEALAASPRLASPQTGVRYNAACAAALAGCGQARDDPPPDESTRRRLRRQALDWLLADLAYWAGAVGRTNPQGRALIRQTLRHWREDADLAGLRDEAALARLDEDERQECRALWKWVEAVLPDAAFPLDPFAR